MSNPIQNAINSNLVVDKLHNSIQDLSSKLNTRDYSSIGVAINETLFNFSEFFKNLQNVEFEPELFYTNDTPRSELYNKNLLSIYNDLKRFYQDLRNLNESQVNSYNFAQILTEELITRANELASTVLDLNILNNFDLGDIIVAGDDFKNSDYIDLSLGSASSPVDFVFGSNGITLGRTSTENVIDSLTKIEVVPISPLSTVEDSTDEVSTEPTPRNLERFYEGNYYNYLGLARPEGGGEFNFKFIAAPTGEEPPSQPEPSDEYDLDVELMERAGAYIELGASKARKEEARRNMLDGNPSTFWECEYAYSVPDPLLDISLPDTGDSEDPPDSQVVTIDLEEAERIARQYDEEGRDLVVDIIVTFSEEKTLNIATFNPVIFGTSAFPEILDISTASDTDGEFTTVEGWNSLRFARAITPEANEYLTQSQLSATLAPNRGAYRGQGIFPFPPRLARKIKFRVKMAYPVAAPYERIYVLLKNDIEITTTTKTTVKKGLFG
jgi:hypothetical protein